MNIRRLAAGAAVTAVSSVRARRAAVVHRQRSGVGRRRRRRLHRRRVVEQLPGRALGQVGRAGHQGGLEAGGGKYISNDAKSSAETQATNVENLISQGANVLIILAQDDDGDPAVGRRRPIDEGIPVIAYDRLIEDPKVLYLTLRQRRGRPHAGRREILKAVPEGNYAIIKGNEADANADFLRAGYRGDHRRRASTPATIKIVGETYTDGWKPENAQTEMEQFLTANNNKVDAVLSENDGMAGGVVAALKAQGLAGKVPVVGQDGDQAALNRVALGTQTVDVWKDARELGKAAGEAALAAVQGPGRHRRSPGTAPFTTPGGNDRDVDPAQAASRSPRTTSRSSSTPAGSPRTSSARASPAGSVAACG